MNENSESKEKTASKKGPVFTAGPFASGQSDLVELAVWENEIVVEGGRKVNLHTVTFSRNYRNEEGWQKTKTLRQQDIPVLIHALQKAYSWILDNTV
jgi:hypothetical protein